MAKSVIISEGWIEANWCDINGGGLVTPDQLEEMNRRVENYKKQLREEDRETAQES